MLHILLLILKILLISILVLLGILLLLVLLVLFVPIRYRVYVEKREAVSAKAKISYMGFVLCFKAVYNEDGLDYKLKSFGGTLMSSQKGIPEEENGNNIQKEKPKTKKISGRKDKTKKISDRKVKAPKDTVDAKFEDSITLDKLEQEDIDFLTSDNEFVEEKQGIFKKLGNFFDKAVCAVKNKTSAITDKISRIKRKTEGYKRFLKRPETKAAFAAVKKALIKILKHLSPRRIKGELLYGTGDPASTGKQLGYLSIALPLYYNKIDITPDFSKKILEGYVSIKGRIRIGSLLGYIIRVLLNKNVLKTIKGFKRL